jgi:hypothetical protein
MSSSSYHFVTKWRIVATKQEIYNTLRDSDALKYWWPAVYLDIKTTKKGDADGRGKEVALFTKGWLPYSLQWSFRVTDVQAQDFSGYSLEALGDLAGRGVWTFQQDGAYCNITYDWRIEAEKPVLKYLSFLLKPLFSANHEWAMRKGLESLKLELRRRRGETNVPPPPRPTFPHNLLNNNIL